MTSLITDKARWSEDSDGIWLSIRVKDRRAAIQAAAEITKPHAVEIKQYREKRSLDANAYMWTLLDKLAAALRTTKEELYRGYVSNVGVFREFHFRPDEAKTLKTAWERNGTGWPTEDVDFTSDGEMVVVRAYYGSSTYNTKQMSRLIDAVVEDCNEQGIETLTQEELERMKAAWKHG